MDADNDHTAQMEAVRNFIQQEVDYIVICPVQEAGWDVVLQLSLIHISYERAACDIARQLPALLAALFPTADE